MINIVFLNGYALTLGAISMSTFSIMGPHNTDLPDPFDIFPIDDTAVCFIKNVVTTPNVEVGEYTYYEDDENPTEFDRKNVLYNRPEFGDKLIIEVLRDRCEHQVHHGRSESQRIDGVDLSL